MPRDIVLAGLPRGGTTLACVLLNRFGNTAALNEPFSIPRLAAQPGRAELIKCLKNEFGAQRDSLLSSGSALSVGVNKKLVTNTIAHQRDETGLRPHQAPLQQVEFPQNLTQDFTLVAKHPNAFSVLLPTLLGDFECFAVVRNPLAVLLSWNSTKLPLRQGRVPAAELFDPDLRSRLENLTEISDRQMGILSHYFEIYRNHLSPETVFRYEDIVATHGNCLTAMVPDAPSSPEVLTSKNTNPAYDKSMAELLAVKLLQRTADWLPFYQPESISKLASELQPSRDRQIRPISRES
jgi:hypothetical protein